MNYCVPNHCDCYLSLAAWQRKKREKCEEQRSYFISGRTEGEKGARYKVTKRRRGKEGVERRRMSRGLTCIFVQGSNSS